MEVVAPWLPLVALAALIACGGGWRKAAWWLAGGAVLVFAVAFGAGLIINQTSAPCEAELCSEHVPLFVGLFLEVMLGALAVLLAAIAVIARVLRS